MGVKLKRKVEVLSVGKGCEGELEIIDGNFQSFTLNNIGIYLDSQDELLTAFYALKDACETLKLLETSQKIKSNGKNTK